jgi:hypothetical protein
MIGNEFNAINDSQQTPINGGVNALFEKALGAQEKIEETSGSLLSPGIWAGYNNYRYQQTYLKGGFYDVTGGMSAPMSRGRAGRALGRNKHRIFNSAGSMTPTGQQASTFVGGRNIFGQTTRRGAKKLFPGIHGPRSFTRFCQSWLNP